MPRQLDIYTGNIEDTLDDITAVRGMVDTTGELLGALEVTLEVVEELANNARALENLAENLESVARLIGKFGPLKVLGKGLTKIIDTVEARVQALREDAEDVKLDVQTYQTALKAMQVALDAADVALANDQADLGAILGSLRDARDGLAGAMPAELEATVQALEATLGDLNRGSFPELRARAQDMIDTATTLVGAATGLEGFIATIRQANDAIGGVFDDLRALAGPLEVIGDILGAFEWVLDAADFVFDAVVSPILDPILEALGITGWIAGLADDIAGLLPSPDLLEGFLSIGDDLAEIFGSTGVPDLLDPLEEAIDALTGRLFGEAGYVAAALGDGTEFSDFLLGRNDIISDASFLDGQGAGDVLSAGDGDDTLSGGDGNDILINGAGDDSFDGGAGTDALVFGGFFDQFRFVVEGGTATFTHLPASGSGLGEDTATGIEFFVFRDATWTLQQLSTARFVDYAAGIYSVSGTARADILVGGALSDTLRGRGGNDHLIGRAGFDVIDGGRGRDTVNYSSESFAGAGAVIVLDQRIADAFGAARSDNIVSVENVLGSAEGDRIAGGRGANVLRGQGGDDTIFGGRGDDRLDGGKGRDVLSGGRGDDAVGGGEGADILIGGRGQDSYFTDGAAPDTLVYGAGPSAWLGLDTADLLNPGADADGAADLPHHIVARLDLGLVRKMNAADKPIHGTDSLEGTFAVVGTDRADRMFAGAAPSLLEGGGGADRFGGFAGTTGPGSVFLGGAGNDRLIARSGSDIFVGGAGRDKVVIEDDAIAGARGWLFGGEGPALAPGTPPADDNAAWRALPDAATDTLDLRGSSHFWVVDYGQNLARAYENLPVTIGSEPVVTSFHFYGFDRILGSEQSDVMSGRRDVGADETGTVIRGYGGDDGLVGGTGHDRLFGGDGDDIFLDIDAGGSRTQLMHGGAGDDMIVLSGTGAYNIVGGRGRDLVSFFDYAQDIQVNLGTGRGFLGATQFRISKVEYLYGGAGNDTLTGSAGGDFIAGEGGDDTILGGDGADILDGGAGRDIVRGGAGRDMIHAGLGTNAIYGGDGYDTLSCEAEVFQFNITLDPAVDRLVRDYRAERDGAWTIDLAAGTGEFLSLDRDLAHLTLESVEAVIGGARNDSLTGSNGNNALDGRAGDDILDGGGGRDVLTGGLGDDRLFGGAGADEISTGAGRNVADGGSGIDSLYVRSDATQVTLDARLGLSVAHDAATGETSSDRFQNFERFHGSAGGDTLIGSARAERLYGGGGHDVIEGGGRGDRLAGGDGNDILWGDTESGAAALVMLNGGGAAGDRLQQPSFTDLPLGAMTVQMLVGGAAPQGDVCLMSYAVPGSSNELTVFATATTLSVIVNSSFSVVRPLPPGGLFDGATHHLAFTLDAASGTLRVFVDGAEAFAVTDDALRVPVANGGFLIFGQDQDSYGGTLDPAQAFHGGLGDIRIHDRVLGEAEIGAQMSRLLDDPATESGLVVNWVVDPASGELVDRLGGQGLTTFGTPVIAPAPDGGRDGRDFLYGGAGRDELHGGGRADRLFGGDGLDRLFGGDGDDRIEGGGAGDRLFGGAGADRFVYRATEDSSGVASRDVIRDFLRGEDVIDLSAIDARAGTPADEAFTLVAGGFSGTAGELRVVRRADATQVRADTDGDGRADLVIELSGRLALDGGDFIL